MMDYKLSLRKKTKIKKQNSSTKNEDSNNILILQFGTFSMNYLIWMPGGERTKNMFPYYATYHLEWCQ